MAYNTAYPPRLLASADDGATPALWAFATTDALSVVLGAGYISNAQNVGLRVGDAVVISETDNGYATALLTVSSMAAGAATLSASQKAGAAGVGITGGTGTVMKSSVVPKGDYIETTLIFDLTGLNSGGTIGDIIGTNGAGVAYVTQITDARNGAIFAGRMVCLEAPAGGDAEFDLYSAAAGTGVEDVAISTLSGTQIINAGTQSLGTTSFFANMPAAGAFLYLVGQGTANATYTAGKFAITMWGY